MAAMMQDMISNVTLDLLADGDVGEVSGIVSKSPLPEISGNKLIIAITMGRVSNLEKLSGAVLLLMAVELEF